MSSKEEILARIRQNTGTRYEKPDIAAMKRLAYPDKIEHFKENAPYDRIIKAAEHAGDGSCRKISDDQDILPEPRHKAGFHIRKEPESQNSQNGYGQQVLDGLYPLSNVEIDHCVEEDKTQRHQGHEYF